MPSNNNFSAATALTSAKTGALASQSNVGATGGVAPDTGEPGHYNYNRGPAYPVARALVGPYNTVWYSWLCPATDYYYFSTRDLTGAMLTNFPSTIQAFTGSAVNALTAVTYVMDQSVGDGNGADNGASIAFLATSGTTYYFQVDTRVANQTGNFHLTWGAYTFPRFGGCSEGPPSFDPSVECMSKVQIADLTSDSYTSFGSFAANAGIFAVQLAAGNPSTTGCPGDTGTTQAGGQIIVDGNFGSFIRWQDYAQGAGSYASGQFVAGSVNNDWCGAAVANSTVPGFAPPAFSGDWTAGPYWDFQVEPTPVPSGTWLGGPPGYYSVNGNYNPGDYFAFEPAYPPYEYCVANVPPHYPGGVSTFWTVLYTPGVPVTPCAEVLLPNHTGGDIGIINFAGSGPNTAQNPTYQLVLYALSAAILSTANGFTLTGSGTSWTINFAISNLSTADFTNTTVALLNTGGISGASSPQTIDLSPGVTTSTGNFTFTATPGLVTATIQLTRNGVVACTLEYPLYPVVGLSFVYNDGPPGSGLNCYERNCTPKTWVQQMRLTSSWPPAGQLPAGWGNQIALSFSIASGGVGTIANDQATNVCAAVTPVTNTVTLSAAYIDSAIRAGVFVTGAVQSIPIQCTVTWVTAVGNISLPTFYQTLSIPAT